MVLEKIKDKAIKVLVIGGKPNNKHKSDTVKKLKRDTSQVMRSDSLKSLKSFCGCRTNPARNKSSVIPILELTDINPISGIRENP